MLYNECKYDFPESFRQHLESFIQNQNAAQMKINRINI